MIHSLYFWHGNFLPTPWRWGRKFPGLRCRASFYGSEGETRKCKNGEQQCHYRYLEKQRTDNVAREGVWVMSILRYNIDAQMEMSIGCLGRILAPMPFSSWYYSHSYVIKGLCWYNYGYSSTPLKWGDYPGLSRYGQWNHGTIESREFCWSEKELMWQKRDSGGVDAQQGHSVLWLV